MRIAGSAMSLPLRDDSVDCIITSPPYGTGIEYDVYTDVPPWESRYRSLVRFSVAEMYRVAKPSARVWVNVMPSVPHREGGSRYPLGLLWQTELGRVFSYRDTVVWMQDNWHGVCAWGSWRRPSAPNLRGSYEIILSFFKPPYKRVAPRNLGKYEDAGEDWQDLCRNVWTIAPAKRTAAAPAPYPEELVERVIRLSTWPGEVCLDPFAGSGTTERVAARLGRTGIGVDLAL